MKVEENATRQKLKKYRVYSYQRIAKFVWHKNKTTNKENIEIKQRMMLFLRILIITANYNCRLKKRVYIFRGFF